MEHGYIFTPPPFLGSGFRQNHQIRSLKSNSYPYLTSHRSVFPSSSHTSPSISLISTRGTGSSFHRTNINSHRRKHLRRCYDLVHICVQRREIGLAARFLKVILAAHEWSSDEGFRLALLLLSLSFTTHASAEEQEEQVGLAMESTRRKIGYLKMLDLNSSAPFKATHITPSLIAEYISSNRLSDAIELLEQRVNVHPYKSQPELHTTLGMLYLFVGIQTLFDNNDCSSSGAAQSQGESSVDSGVDVRHLDRTNRNKARACFEAAIQASATWKRSEITKRQRVYGMHRKSVDDVEKRLRKRETLWGKDVLVEDDQNAWPTTEHRDLKRIRAKLEGSPPTANDRDGDANDNSDLDSSASGSVYAESDAQSSLASEQEPEEDHDQRGRSQSRRAASSEPNNLPEEVGEAEEALPRTRGQRAWAQVWSEVEKIYTPEPPLAYHMAKHFLQLLTPPARPSRRRVKDTALELEHKGLINEGTEDAESLGTGMNRDGSESVVGDGLSDIQLTREEAELRLRRILFEDGPGQEQEPQKIKREKGKDKESKGEGKKRRRESHESEHDSVSQHRHKKKKKETKKEKHRQDRHS